MKRLAVTFLSVILAMVMTVPVMAQDTASDIKVTQYSGHYYPGKPDDISKAEVFTLSVNRRYADGSFTMPADQTMTLESEKTDLTGITAEMKTSTGQKDITVKVTATSQKEAKLTINFSNQWVSTSLNSKEAILIKKGNETLKEIKFSYSTPYFQDEHQSVTNSLTQWSGTWGSSEGINYKYSGVVDVYGKAPTLTYTFTAPGNQGVKAFHLNPDGYFTFIDGSTTYTKINHAKNASNKVQIKCKASYMSDLKTEMLNYLRDYGTTSNQLMVFNDIVVEFEDGCTFGGAMDPIYLGHQVTLKPAGKVNVSTSKNSATSIKIKWSKMTSPVSVYQIYRSTKKESGYKLIKTVSNKTTSYTNKKLKKSKTYYYKVRAYRNVYYQKRGITYKTRIYGAYSTPLKSATRPGKAQAYVQKKGKRIKITNKKIAGATGYRFYLKKGKKGKYKRVKQYTGSKKRTYTSKKLKKGTYYIKIRAYKQVNGKKYFGSYSKSKKIRIK